MFINFIFLSGSLYQEQRMQVVEMHMFLYTSGSQIVFHGALGFHKNPTGVS